MENPFRIYRVYATATPNPTYSCGQMDKTTSPLDLLRNSSKKVDFLHIFLDHFTKSNPQNRQSGANATDNQFFSLEVRAVTNAPLSPHWQGKSKPFVQLTCSCNPALPRLHGMQSTPTEVLSFPSMKRGPKVVK